MFVMKKLVLRVLFLFIFLAGRTNLISAQCSICTKTAMQQGEKPAQGLNSGIIYLMLTPFAVAGYIGYKWWQSEKENFL
ncbi:MAG: hypothetical protein H0X70_01420 [Segetibacter sp.]|jgi:hypothetical protein|nr:hypothetical protein [Segetibacter sp.]